jgi:hypothetical protein
MKYSPVVYLEKLRKITKNFRYDCRSARCYKPRISRTRFGHMCCQAYVSDDIQPLNKTN